MYRHSRCWIDVARRAHVMLMAMLRSHMMLIRMAEGRLGGEVARGEGGGKAVPSEITTSCCDI